MNKITIKKLAQASIKKAEKRLKKAPPRHELKAAPAKPKIQLLPPGNPEWREQRAKGKVVGIPFKPGEIHNPGGKPSNKPITEALKAYLREPYRGPNKEHRVRQLTNGQVLAIIVVENAMTGDMRATEELLNRTEGKVPNPTTLSGPNGGPIDISAMSAEEKAARIAELTHLALGSGEGSD